MNRAENTRSAAISRAGMRSLASATTFGCLSEADTPSRKMRSLCSEIMLIAPARPLEGAANLGLAVPIGRVKASTRLSFCDRLGG